jgi:chromosome segregation ATPase
MDKPEQPPQEPTKHARVRLAAPKKQLERTIQKMTKLSETAMKPEKLVDLLIWMGRLQVRLLDMDRDAKKDALVEENERLKSELAARPTNNDTDDGLKTILEWRNGQLKDLEGDVTKLKSDGVKLQTENTELATTCSELKSANSELNQTVQRLIEEKAEMEFTIMTLETRTPQELMNEALAKAGTSLKTS